MHCAALTIFVLRAFGVYFPHLVVAQNGSKGAFSAPQHRILGIDNDRYGIHHIPNTQHSRLYSRYMYIRITCSEYRFDYPCARIYTQRLKARALPAAYYMRGKIVLASLFLISGAYVWTARNCLIICEVFFPVN